MSQVKLAAKFSKAEQPDNGMTDPRHVAAMIDEPHQERYAIVRYRTLRISDEIEEGTRVPTAKLTGIEPLGLNETEEEGRKLYEAANRERTGRDPQMALDFGVDGEVPEPSGEEILAERRERLAEVADESDDA